MRPLKVTATLDGQIMGPSVHLDSVLAAVIAERLQMPPMAARHKDDQEEAFATLRKQVAQVIQIDPSGRFFWCSDAQFAVEEYDRRFVNRRFPVDRVTTLGSDKVKRVELGTGLSKSYRIPTRACFVQRDEIQWFVLGHREPLLDLVSQVSHLGKKRSVGLGLVTGWRIESIEAWDGFPILREGSPLRPLPLDYPGLTDYKTDMRALRFPYWRHTDEQPCAV